MSETADVVPFGKYKGQPLERMLADRGYCDWLVSQPGFRERFTTVYNVIVGAGGEPQDTPEHNAMQARYLDHAEALRIAERWLPTADDMLERWEASVPASLTEPQRANLDTTVEGPRVDSLYFEHCGWDLTFTASRTLVVAEVDADRVCVCACTVDCARKTYRYESSAPPQDDPPWIAPRPAAEPRRVEVLPDLSDPAHEWSACYNRWDAHRARHCADGCPAGWTSDRQYTAYSRARSNTGTSVTVAVELKPVVGDDYPTILRQVLRRIATSGDCGHNVVLADRAEFSTVTLDQVKRIFASQGVTFLLAVELLPAGDCACDACSVGARPAA